MQGKDKQLLNVLSRNHPSLTCLPFWEVERAAVEGAGRGGGATRRSSREGGAGWRGAAKWNRVKVWDVAEVK